MQQLGLANIKIDDAVGAPTDITAEVTGYEGPSSERLTARYYTMDTLNAKISEGGKAGRLSITVLVEKSLTSAHGLLRTWHEAGGARTITISEPGTAAGDLKYDAEYVPTGDVTYTRGEAGSINPRTATFTFEREGALTMALIV